MKITAQYIVILTLSRVVMSFECIRDGCYLNYNEISIAKGIKLRKQHESLSNNSIDARTDTRLELNAKTIKSKSYPNEVTLHSLMYDFLNNHVLEFNLSKLFQEEAEVPRRRRHHNAFQMVLMGIVIFLMFFVTLGFQFLATFGGKAFLMAKLALLLASINGLKRWSTLWTISSIRSHNVRL
ncbi:hypothetical protein ACKWTF_010318 [Chironomus riparius]